MQAYGKDKNDNTENFTTLSNYIRNVPIENDEIIVSFEVTSLNTNIPIIKDYVNNNDQITRKTITFQDKFLNLVNLVLTITWYIFDSPLYQQPDGVAVGGPTCSTTAKICMQAHEQTAIYTALHLPNVWD